MKKETQDRFFKVPTRPLTELNSVKRWFDLAQIQGGFIKRRALIALPIAMGVSAPAWTAIDLSITGVSPGTVVEEGDTTLTVTVAVSGSDFSECGSAADTPNLGLQFMAVTGAGGSATAGTDFTGLPQQVSANLTGPGSVAFNVQIVEDAQPEADETFSIALADPSGQINCMPSGDQISPAFTVGSPVAVTIANDDANQAPDGQIDTPFNSLAVPIGGTVTFNGSGTDPDGDTNLSFAWDFGDGRTSTAQNPGPLVFNTEGTFDVTLTVTDSLGLADPTPATIRITVGNPPSPIQGLLQPFAQTGPQRAIAGTIEVICPRGNNSDELQRDCNAVVGAAFSNNAVARTGDDPGVSTALAQITPDQASTPVDASQNSIDVQARNVGKRLTALRRGAGVSFQDLTFNIDGQTLSGKQFASLYDGLLGQTGGAAGSDGGVDFGRLGIFVNGSITFGDKDETDNESGYDFDTKGITVGADYRFNDNFVLGAAFGYLNTDVDLDANGGGLDTDGYSFSLYGTYFRADQFYMDGLVSYGRNDFDQDRNVRYTLSVDVDPNTPGVQNSVNQTLTADYDGDQWDLSVGAGYDFNRGGWTFGPVGRLEYVKADVDSYREKAPNTAPGSGWTVQIDDQEFESFTLSLGGQASYAISMNWGVLTPQLRVEWVHEFDDDAETINGRFVGDPNNRSFQFQTDDDDADYFSIGVGAAAYFAQGRSAFIQYQGLVGYEDLEQHSVNLGVRLEF